MDKERVSILESGFSEKQSDLAVDKTTNNDQVKAGNIFVPQKTLRQAQGKKPQDLK